MPQQAFQRWNDPQGNRLISMNRDGSIFCQGVGFVVGGALLVGPIPIIQGSDTQIDSIAPTVLVENLPLTTLYQVTFYYYPSDNTGSGTWQPTLTWYNPKGALLTLGSPYLGVAEAGHNPPDYGQSYSIPVLAKGGTNVTVSGSYSGTPFPMDIALRIVAMP